MATLVIALTGEAGAGKSTAARWFSEQGAVLLDADALVRELWRGVMLPQLARGRWGDGVFLPDGRIDTKAVSARIFSDDTEYEWLCGVIHPLVFGLMKAALPKDGIVVAEIPMLFEAGRPEWVDRVLFMEAGKGARAERNRFRGLDENELARRDKFFVDSETRKRNSDWVICNDGTPEELKERLGAVWREIRALAAQ